MHRTLAAGATAVVASLAFAAPSFAASTPIPLSFNHVVVSTPATGQAQVVSATTQPLAVTANTDLSTGNFTIDPADFSAPTYSFTSPVPGTLTLALANQASGNVNLSTGAVTMTADVLATITSASLGGSCTIDTGPLTYSTATTQPLPGQNFPAGPTGVVSGTGAFGAGWTSLKPGTGPACSTVDSFIDNGAGGIWISRNIDPSAAGASAPKIAVTAAKPAPVVAGKTAKVKVTVKNSGGALTKSLKVCLSAKSPLKASKCGTVKGLGAAKSKTLTFTVKTTKATKAGKHLLKLTVTGQKAKTITLVVTKATAKR